MRPKITAIFLGSAMALWLCRPAALPASGSVGGGSGSPGGSNSNQKVVPPGAKVPSQMPSNHKSDDGDSDTADDQKDSDSGDTSATKPVGITGEPVSTLDGTLYFSVSDFSYPGRCPAFPFEF